MSNGMSQTKDKISKELKLGNIMAAPLIKKIVVNVGFGSISGDKKAQEAIFENLKKITGQSPSETKARKAISSFKIREGQVVGARVTLRGDKMHAFFKKLVAVVLPRVRDFRGVLVESFDGNGNYTLGFREVNVFPEIEFARGEKQFGLEITIQTSAKTDDEAKKLLEIMGLPFKKTNNKGRGG
jgi:large subunit ribosomal protein L5